MGADTTVPPAMVSRFFRIAPVHLTEKLEAASSRVLDWLLKRAVQVDKRDKGHDLAVMGKEVVAILIDRAGEHVADLKLRELRQLAAPVKNLSKIEQRQRDRLKKEWTKRKLPGATLVVDARICGLRDGMLDEKCDSNCAVADADERWREEREDPSAESPRPLIRFRVQEISSTEDEEGLKLPGEHQEWLYVQTIETRFDEGGSVRGGLAVLKWRNGETGEGSQSILSVPQALSDHAEHVAARAHDLATSLKLPDEEAEALAIAACLHDDGKAAERWQDAMNAPRDGRPYAKTRGGVNWRRLEGYRHEFGSLLNAERENLPDSTRDLILHLIGAHHGYARPLITPAGCQDAPPSLLESKAGEAALRFVRLQRRYGHWGLAWREAILRAADRSASRECSRIHGEHNDG